MSRSSAVWVIQDSYASVVATFTVRHELCTWLYNRETLYGLYGYRFQDGPVNGASSDRTKLNLFHLYDEGERMAKAQEARRAAKTRNWPST